MRGALFGSVLVCATAHGSHHAPASVEALFSPSSSGLRVTTIGGSGADELSAVKPCRKDPSQHKDGPAKTSTFGAPTRVQVIDGVAHVLDTMNGCIRTISNGTVGSATPCCTTDIATDTEGGGPQDMHIGEGMVHLLDSYNNQLKSSPWPFEKWTVIAGNGERPTKGQTGDGPALEQALNNPHGIAVTTDGSGDVYIANTFSSCVQLLRKAVLTTIAGKCGFGGHVDGSPLASRFQHPHHINLDPRNESVLYLSDAECWDDDSDDDMPYAACAKTDGGVCFSGIRKIELDRSTGLAVGVSTVAGKATQGKSGSASKSCNDYVDGSTSVAMFDFIHGTAFDPLTTGEKARLQAGEALGGSDRIIVCDEDSNRIRQINLKTNVVSTIAGSGKEGPKDGSASKAKFTYPGGIGLDTDGNIFVGDYESHRVRLISKSSTELV